MRFLVVFAAFLALAFARAVPKTTQSTTQTATSGQTTSGQSGLTNIEKFLLGVLDGYVEKKYDVNLTCVYDDLEAFANDLENAMSAGENDDWADFGKDVWSGIQDLYNAVEGCHPAEPWWEKIFDDLKKILDFAFPEVQWIDDALSFVVNGVEVGTDAYNAYEDWEAGNYFDAGQALGDLIGTVTGDDAKLGANPSPPSWPLGFSASVFANNWQNQGQTVFFRWFYDQTLDQSRVDGLGQWLDEQYWAIQIWDHVHEIQWSVYMQPGFETCFMQKINTSLPVPNFQGAVYAGQAVINYSPVYHWILNQGSFTMQYFDNQATREPVRMDFDDASKQMANTLLFTEFDAGAQDPALFTLPQEVYATCNSV